VAAARARILEAGNLDVADVARVAARAGHRLPAEDQAAAHSGRDDHSQDVVDPLGRADPVLGQRDAEAIHPQRDGHARRRCVHQPLHLSAKRVPSPRRQVQWRDGPVAHRDRARRSDSHPDQLDVGGQ